MNGPCTRNEEKEHTFIEPGRLSPFRCKSKMWMAMLENCTQKVERNGTQYERYEQNKKKWFKMRENRYFLGQKDGRKAVGGREANEELIDGIK